jgi:hypothetical protein
MIDISIITPCMSHLNLAKFLQQLSEQSNDGITYELILILEAQDHSKFTNIHNPLLNQAKIFKTKPHYDYGATARDLGLLHALGEYVLFWDDDNIYYKHALAAQYANIVGYDLGISKAYHLNYIIPNSKDISPGDIDTINICVSKQLAKKCKWSHNGTKYSDYIYIIKLLEHNPVIRYSDIIIGHHL